jgi:hypothetical protein
MTLRILGRAYSNREFCYRPLKMKGVYDPWNRIVRAMRLSEEQWEFENYTRYARPD